jgi:hypothetical protein
MSARQPIDALLENRVRSVEVFRASALWSGLSDRHLLRASVALTGARNGIFPARTGHIGPTHLNHRAGPG